MVFADYFVWALVLASIFGTSVMFVKLNVLISKAVTY